MQFPRSLDDDKRSTCGQHPKVEVKQEAIKYHPHTAQTAATVYANPISLTWHQQTGIEAVLVPA